MRLRSALKLCTHFTGDSKEMLRRPSSPDNKVFVPRLGLGAPLRQQQSFASLKETERRYTVPVNVQDRCRSAKPSVFTSLRPCRPDLASITLQVLHHQVLHRGVQCSSSVSVASALLLVFRVDDGTPQRSFLFSLQFVLPLKRQIFQFEKFSEQLLRQTAWEVQKLKSNLWSLSKRSELCQKCVPSVGGLCSSFCKGCSTQPVVMH